MVVGTAALVTEVVAVRVVVRVDVLSASTVTERKTVMVVTVVVDHGPSASESTLAAEKEAWGETKTAREVAALQVPAGRYAGVVIVEGGRDRLEAVCGRMAH